jgi:hypothetical protein
MRCVIERKLQGVSLGGDCIEIVNVRRGASPRRQIRQVDAAETKKT